jgi:hypothetical protein
VAERDIRKALKARVEAYGGTVRAVAWLGRRNAPDVLCLFPYDSRFGVLWFGKRDWPTAGAELHPFIEAKAPDGKPTDAQLREHERMRVAGCTVLVISTIAQLDAWLPPR